MADPHKTGRTGGDTPATGRPTAADRHVSQAPPHEFPQPPHHRMHRDAGIAGQRPASGKRRVGHDFTGTVGLHQADGHTPRVFGPVDADGEGLRRVAGQLRCQHRGALAAPPLRADHFAVDQQLCVARRCLDLKARPAS